jgi:hypothetical protein
MKEKATFDKRIFYYNEFFLQNHQLSLNSNVPLVLNRRLSHIKQIVNVIARGASDEATQDKQPMSEGHAALFIQRKQGLLLTK